MTPPDPLHVPLDQALAIVDDIFGDIGFAPVLKRNLRAAAVTRPANDTTLRDAYMAGWRDGCDPGMAYPCPPLARAALAATDNTAEAPRPVHGDPWHLVGHPPASGGADPHTTRVRVDDLQAAYRKLHYYVNRSLHSREDHELVARLRAAIDTHPTTDKEQDRA